MKDTEPVLVVHGIGHRDERDFCARVHELSKGLGSRYSLIPVHWGVLAASTEHLDHIMQAKPQDTSSQWGGLPDNDGATPEVNDLWGGAMALVNGTIETVSSVGNVFGTVAQAADEGLRSFLRSSVCHNIVPYLGDILVYQGARERFHAAVRSCIPEGYGSIARPIKAIGHSLGGVMLFDMAVSESAPLAMHLVTLGSQPSFFHLQHRRSEAVCEFTGRPVLLPPSLRSWVNVLDDDDWLSFAVEPIFRLSDSSGPHDRWVDNTAGTYSDVFTLAAHTSYWENPAVHAIVRQALDC